MMSIIKEGLGWSRVGSISKHWKRIGRAEPRFMVDGGGARFIEGEDKCGWGGVTTNY